MMQIASERAEGVYLLATLQTSIPLQHTETLRYSYALCMACLVDIGS